MLDRSHREAYGCSGAGLMAPSAPGSGPVAPYPDQDWRRYAVKVVLSVVIGVAVLYELHLRFPRQERPQPAPAPPPAKPEARPPGFDFGQELTRAKNEPPPEWTLANVRTEFQEKYAEKARDLLCSGCKLTAERIGDELTALNASGQPDPTALLNVTKEAVAAACTNLPQPLVILNGRGQRGVASFAAHDEGRSGGEPLTGIELRKADMARRNAQRLCQAVLHDYKWGMLEAMIRHKVPHERHRTLGQAPHDSWERWLCAKHARLCKRREVKEDDEDDEEGEL